MGTDGSRREDTLPPPVQSPIRQITPDIPLGGSAFPPIGFFRVGPSGVAVPASRRPRSLCERVLGYASPLGLYADEVDPKTGRHLGNFPQAFTHLALINAVMHVIQADEQESLARSPWADWRP